MDALEVIARKRDGHTNTCDEIRFLLSAFLEGTVPDYQMAAWLMAVCIRGMTADETLDLTQAMVESGETLDLSSLPGVKVDKHSTGGVGDKVTLIAGPLAAACGGRVTKRTGRALAHTGGTIDKLESLPGLTVDLALDRFREQVRRVGIAIAAQSPRMVPADRALYALRDVTATVPSIPLIASSVMSKKLAAGADAIVLDVKVGRGAFMRDLGQAQALAAEMVALGEGAGRRVVALLTAMDDPLGRRVGNALEVVEAIEVLEGRGDPALTEVSLEVAREMCRLAGVDADPARALTGGSGLARFWDLLEAQGAGRAHPPAVHPVCRTLTTDRAGWVSSIDALAVGMAVVDAGGGRRRKEDPIDHGAGITIEAPVGTRVQAGEPLAHVHAASEELADRALQRLRTAWTVGPAEVRRPPHIRARVDRNGCRVLV